MIFRVFGAIIFTSIGGVIGFSLAERLRSARKRCTAIGHMFSTSAFLIGSLHEDVYAICRHFKSDPELKCFDFPEMLPEKYIAGEDFHSLWEKAICSEAQLGNEEKELLLRFGAMLGKSDISTQLGEIRALQTELDELSAVRRDELLKKGRLYRAAGLLFGVMAGILVL